MDKHKLATLCYTFTNNKLLLLHRTKKVNDMHEGKYIGLGGKMEPFESPYECMVREIKEEANIIPKDLTLRSVIYFKEEGGKNTHPALNYLVFVYRMTKFKGEPVDSNEGELVWKTFDEFNNLNLWEGDKIFVPKVIKENLFFEATFVYNKNEKLVEYNIRESNCR